MKFLHEKPGLILNELSKKTLLISDLHLGIEYEIYKKGISIPPRVGRQKERILKIQEDSGIERLILLGDVKHNVPKISIGEKERLPDFFKELDGLMEVHLVKGNHDGSIEKLTGNTNVKVHPTGGFKLGKFYFNHGHAWPDKDILKAETLVRGHSHPALEFKDKLGYSSVVPCWVKGDVDSDKLEEKTGGEGSGPEKFVIVPAFSELISGTPVNNEEDSLLGPLLENGVIQMKESNGYLMDGTLLGKIKDI